MRQVLRYVVFLCLIGTLLPAATIAPVNAQSEVVADDELVIINQQGRIEVRDPYTPSGYVRLTWESPQDGFGRVATGDFNGDGTDEIVGLRFNQAIVYDPYRQPGESDVASTFTTTPNQESWQWAVTGAFWGGSRDGLVVVQRLNQANLQARLVVYSFDIALGAWTQTFAQDLGAGFAGLATGDVDGDGRDELVGIRNPGAPFDQIIVFDPSQNWATIYEGNYNYPWVAIAVGNIQGDGQNKDEIATTRSGVGSNLASFLVFRWTNNTTLQDVAAEKFLPNFVAIALGDVTGNGDDEVFLLRPGMSGSTPIVALTSRFDDGPFQLNELAGQTRFGNLITADTDADDRDELIVMAANEYIIYTEPATSQAFTPYVGLYSTGLSFAAGNLDGAGIPQGPRLLVSPALVTLTLQGGQTDTRDLQISNIGTGTINWTSSVPQGASWLSIQPTSGTAGTTPNPATLRINAVNLAAGTYTGTVRISGQAGVAGSPQDITVNLTVTAPPSPQLSVTPTQISLTVESGQTATQQVQIANTGAGTINWTASLIQGAPWLSFSPPNGTATATTPSMLTAMINAVDVQPGQYTGKVRIAGGAGVLNSPQDVTVSLTVTAPPFSVTPREVTWTYIPPAVPGNRTVTVAGIGISWHAGVVPMDSMQRIKEAIDAGRQMSINNGFLVLGDGVEDVPIVDYIDVSPSSSTAIQTDVTLSLVISKVPYGWNQAAVVFVADGIASPPAVVVRASVLKTLPGATDLTFMPMVVASQ